MPFGGYLADRTQPKEPVRFCLDRRQELPAMDERWCPVYIQTRPLRYVRSFMHSGSKLARNFLKDWGNSFLLYTISTESYRLVSTSNTSATKNACFSAFPETLTALALGSPPRYSACSLFFSVSSPTSLPSGWVKARRRARPDVV